jgi:hypothetical protein
MKFHSRNMLLCSLCLFCFQAFCADTTQYAGFRASRILGNYPNRQFPSPWYWSSTAESIAAKFPGSTPGGIWIVSLYISNGITQFNFPADGITLPYVNFISTDQNEAYLTHFDTLGIKVWLQVEPGHASIDTLISIVLNRYKHHPSVMGFGVDVEWFRNNAKVTDSMAQRWEQKLLSIDSTYSLFLKHYSQSWMPSKYRGKILFVDDSQDFTSSANPLSYMTNEFKSWGASFAPNTCAFQFGYAADSVWWTKYADPFKTIGDALKSAIPTIKGLFWVDFTLTKLFPVMQSESGNEVIPSSAFLHQNYPNPFNPTTQFGFRVSERGMVKLVVYDILGRETAVLVNEEKPAGSYTITWDASALPSGGYLYTLQTGNFSSAKKLVLMK